MYVDGRPVWESVAHLAPAVQRLEVARPQGEVSTAMRRATLDTHNIGHSQHWTPATLDSVTLDTRNIVLSGAYT